MTDKLLEFLNDTKWSQYIYDKEVQVLASQLKDRVTTLTTNTNEDENNSTEVHRVKIVVVGDGAVGKTSLLISYAKREFPETYVPTVFENFTAQTTRKSDGSSILLHLWDTAGQEDYDRLRPLSYPGADIVLLCFSTVNHSTFESIKEKWYPEVNHYIPDAPIFLIGTKIDLRELKEGEPQKQFEPVSEEQGMKMKESINATRYIEVSAKNQTNLDHVFEEAIEVVLKHRLIPEANDEETVSAPTRKKKKNNCILL